MKAQVTETIAIAQAKKALEQTAVLYFDKDAAGNYRMDRRRARPVCLMGPVGVGKTEIVRQVAEECGLAFLSYSITHHTRQSAIGLPRLRERDIDGKTVSVTEYTMSEIIAEVYRVMEESGKQEGILFLDEFNCASETMRPIMLQLLQNKTFGPHAIPRGWMLVLAGNPPEYNASAVALDAVTADRLRLLWLKPDYPDWRAYMVTHHVHPVVLSYLDDHKSHFYQYEQGKDGTALVTARGWEDLSVMLWMMAEKGFEVDLPFVAQYLQSSVVARDFLTYYRQYEAFISSGVVDAIFAGKSSRKVVEPVKEMTFQKKWALTSVVLARLQSLCEQTGETQADAAKAMENVITFYAKNLPDSPQLEFLVGGITGCDACAAVIMKTGCQAYSAAVGKVYFGDKPSAQKLKQLVEKAG